MSGIGSTMSIAKTAIAAQQVGLTVTGNNIANVNNPNYSMQNADHLNRTPSLYAGFLFGTGVNTSQIQQSVDKFLEVRLTDEESTQAAFEEAEAYMKILEGYFDENSNASITSIMVEFWNSWHDLSDNPLGSSERVSVYEKGSNLAGRLNKANTDLTNMAADIDQEIKGALGQINSYSSQIAALNVQITGLEGNRSANDLRDQRNSLLGKLGQLIDIDTFEQDSGAIIVNAANGSTLVNGADHYNLTKDQDRILWQGSYGADVDITDRIAGGKLGGWLEIRDEILPKFTEQMDVFARETIWAMNYQHSQGAGLEYYTGSVTGDYKADQSGLLSSYSFGDKIDYSKAFVLWLQDKTSVNTQYSRTQIDMGLSGSKVSDWQGVGYGGEQSRYKLTVMDGATLGNKEVAQTDGSTLAQVHASTDMATALDAALVAQTITVSKGPSGTKVVNIKDVGGDAQRSAASIAAALSAIDGVDAYASELSATFDPSGITTAEDGDEVQFSLYVEGVVHKQKFTVDSQGGTISMDEQFENALRDAAKSINTIKTDEDLFTKGLTITSSSGRTLGVQDFEVVENAGIRLNLFSNLTGVDTVTLTVGSGSGATADISVDLSSVDGTDQAALSTAFYTALNSGLEGKPFTVEHDPSTNSVILRTTDGSALTVKDGDNNAGAGAASIAVTQLLGTGPPVAPGDNIFWLNGSNDDETFVPIATPGDTIGFIGEGTPVPPVPIGEVSAGGVAAGVIVGTVTIVTEPGMTLQSNVAGAGGLFNGNLSKPGSSIMTLGGEGGFEKFNDVVSFKVDGVLITYDASVAAAVGAAAVPPYIPELQFATELAVLLTAALPVADYSVVRNGKSVSIIKNIANQEPIKITDFAETVSGDAKLRVTTGTGKGASDPQNDLLESGNTFRNFATASLYEDDGIIKWEKYDAKGLYTGQSGLINVEEKGRVSIVENGVPTLSFDLAAGSLVAGNTLIINTDKTGRTDPLDFSVSGAAKTKNEIYKFTVTTGGKMGELAADKKDTMTIEWKTASSSGTFQLTGHDPPKTPAAPIEVEVDGMTLSFSDGTLFENDVFTITTDESGIPVSKNAEGDPTGELLSDWHWTIDSFADQFNRQAGGMTASTTFDHRLSFATSSDYHALTNLKYSGSNGFNKDNVTITVADWGAIDFAADDLQLIRSSAGDWGLGNDPTGGFAKFIPEGGDDDGFGIDFSGDGLADIHISFTQKVSGQGSVQMDLEKRSSKDLSFAFSDDSVNGSSGLLAAAGINTFFKGDDAMTMEMNSKLKDTRYVAAGKINSTTGEISQGDNSNALAMANVQHQDITMKQWTYDRGSDGQSSLTTTTLDGYYSTMIGSMGIIARRIQSSREFADTMVNNLTEQRNSVSAVSLDEEMIKLMKYQHAFSAASKLLTVSDEMLNTLISMR